MQRTVGGLGRGLQQVLVILHELGHLMPRAARGRPPPLQPEGPRNLSTNLAQTQPLLALQCLAQRQHKCQQTSARIRTERQQTVLATAGSYLVPQHILHRHVLPV